MAVNHRTDAIYGTVALLLGLILLAIIPFGTDDKSSVLSLDNTALLPSFYPRAVAILIILVAAWIVVSALVSRVAVGGSSGLQNSQTTGSIIAGKPPPASFRTGTMLAAVIVYTVVVNVVGFRSGAIILGIACARWLGATWRMAVIVGIVPAIALYGLFAVALGVPLPADIY